MEILLRCFMAEISIKTLCIKILGKVVDRVGCQSIEDRLVGAASSLFLDVAEHIL